MMIAWLIVAGLCLIAAIALVVKPVFISALPAWVGMMTLYMSGYLTDATMPMWKLLMWTCATLIVVGIKFYQPSGEPDGRNTGNIYVGLGAATGALLGVVVGSNFIVLCTIVGALMGLMAYSRTPHGRWIKFASPTFIQYFCARCLPAIVSMSMVGMSAEAILFYIRTCYFYTA